jgi:quercetin dioxygenase-like cupin family protein
MESIAIDWNTVQETPTQVGSIRRFFDLTSPLLAQVECHVTTLNPGMEPHPPHQHRAEELLILQQGVLEATLGEEVTVLGAGAVIFVASNELHGWRNTGEEPAVYYVIRLETRE